MNEYKYKFRIIKKKEMQVLLNMRNESYRTRNNSLFILNLFALQFISLIALNRLGPFYLKIAQLLLIVVDDKWSFSPLPLLINFGFNIALIGIFSIIQFFKDFHYRQILIKILSIIVLNFKYIMLIPIGCINVTPLASPDTPILYKLCCSFNMAVTFILSAIELYTNWSNRFIEKDYCNRRENSILCLFFQFGFVFSTIMFGTLVGSLFLIAVSVFRAYQVSITVEYPLIQSSTFFYSSLNIYMCVVFLVGEGKLGFLDLTCKIIIGVLVSQYFSRSACIFINSFYGNSKNLYKIHKPTPSSQNSQKQPGQPEIENKSGANFRDIIVLSRILLSKKKTLSSALTTHNSNGSTTGNGEDDNQWAIWWQKYTMLLVSHRVLCTSEKCECRKVDGRKGEETAIVVEDLRKFMAKLEEDDKSLDLRIMGIYLNVQIVNKPLKAYYEIIRMRSEEVSVTNQVDLQCLLVETRECFSRIFLMNNIQNSSLPLMKILKFEELVESLQSQIKQALEASINFHELFLLNSIKVTQVFNDSKKIFEIKDKIGNRLEDLVLNFPDSFIVTFFIFIFYQYLQVYRSKQKQLKIISQQKNLRRRLFEKQDQDIFSPEYGVIYIDLVQERGKIKKLTKNICQLYGHNYEDMISFNINQFMPQIFSKYHYKFLSNFIEMGKIKILADRKRLIFAKNKSKFIFPVYVRMKTEHLLSSEFGVTALIKKMNTTSQFILFGGNGKIEEVTERIYKMIFHPCLKAEVDKTRRLCLVKMIPALMDLINDPNFEKNSQQVHESLFIFSNQVDMLQKFRIHREPRSHDGYQSNTYVSGSMELEQTTNQMSMNGVGLGASYFGQVFKAFLNELNIVKLNAYLVNYKLVKLKTEEFSIFLLEIVSIEVVESPFLAAIEEYKKAAEKLNIYEEYGSIRQNFDKYKAIFDRNDVLNYMFNMNVQQEKMNKNAVKKYRQNDEKGHRKKIITILDDPDKLNEGESIPESSQMNNFNDLNNLAQPQILPRGGSERSSITDQTQSQSKKQMLINAFNTHSIRIGTKFLLLINLAIVLMFSILTVFVVKAVQDVDAMFVKEESDMMNIDVKQVFEFRLASQEIQMFYGLAAGRGFGIDAERVGEIGWIRDQLNNQYTDSLLKIKEITSSGQNSQIFQSVPIYDPSLQQTTETNLLELLNQLDYKYRSNDPETRRLFFHENYETIHKKLLQICQADMGKLISSATSTEISTPLIIFALYELIVVLLALLWIPVLWVVSAEERKIVHLLTTMNIREIKRATQKLRLLLDNMKISKVKEVNHILALLSDQKVENAIQMEKEKSMTRNIRLVEEPGSYSIKPKQVSALLLAFLCIFSVLPIALYLNIQLDTQTYQKTLQVMQENSLLADKTGTLVNIYIGNVNRVYLGEEFKVYDNSIMDDAEREYFNLTELISQAGSVSKDLLTGTGGDAKFSDLLCLEIACLGNEKAEKVKYYEQILLIRNSLGTLNPQKLNLQTLSIPQLDQWVQESNAIAISSWVHKIYLFTQLWNSRLRTKIEGSLSQTTTRLIILAAILIPLYIVCMGYIEGWLIGRMSGILRNAESVHMHFSVQVLAENTYLTSYFNDKIKSNK